MGSRRGCGCADRASRAGRRIRAPSGQRDILPGVNAGASRTARWDICWSTIQPVLSGEPSRSRGRTDMSMAVPHSRYSYPHREDSELSSAAYSLCRTSYLIVVDYRGISGQSVIGGLVSKCRIHARRKQRDSLLVKR